MELSAAIRARHMVRSFTGRPLAGDAVERVLDAARRAPSAGNTAGWEAVVLVGPEQTASFWQATTTGDWRARSWRWPGMSKASVVVALFVQEQAYLARYSEPDKVESGLGKRADAWPVPYWFVDGGLAALLMLLAAVDEGMGACFVGNFRGERELRVALGVPDDRRYLGAVLLGEASDDDRPSSSAARSRPTAAQVFHRGRW
jgi:nitroreductase